MQRRTKISTIGALTAVTGLVAISIGVATSFVHAAGPTTFSNTGAIAINDASGSGPLANPYPSNITVSGMPGLVSDVNVTLSGLTHSATNDVDILLVGPGGANIVLLSDPGGSSTLVISSNASVTFDDSAAGGFPQSGTVTGTATYRPTDTDSDPSADAFPAPAPAPSASTTLNGAFASSNPNGTWSLYIVDDATGDAGSISGGWSITITTDEVAVATSTSLTASPNPSLTGGSVTFTATVSSSGSPVTTGTVTFTDGAATLGAPVSVNGSGQASVTTSALAERAHSITATYNGAPGFLTSNGSVTQVVDNATSHPDPTTWCNTGPLSVPNSGPATPYPSRITVSGAGTSVSQVSVQLLNVTHAVPIDLDVLLVGPQGQNIVLMSDVGGTNPTSNVNLVIADIAAGAIPTGGPLVSGTFQPSNDSGGDVFPAPAPAVTSATALATFAGTNPNGLWSLYVLDDATGDVGSIAGGWCLDITTPVSTTTTLSSSNNPSLFGAPVTFTATVSSSGNPVTSGTVTFTDGATTLGGAVSVSGSGEATLTTSLLAVGSHPITATYNGTASFLTSNESVTQVVDGVADAGGPYTIAEGASLSLDATGSLSGPGATFSWDINDDGTFGDATGATPTLTWSQLNALGIDDDTGAAATQVAVRVTDGPTFSAVTPLTITNVAPTAALSNNGPVPEGSTATVTFSSVTDPSSADLASLTYSYDFDNDGTFEVTGSPSPSAIVPSMFIVDGPSSLVVRGNVADDDGGSSALTTTISITNAASTATIDGPSTATVGVPITIKVGADDPSTADMSGMFVYTVDWGDGTPVETLSGPADPPVTHTYTAPGTYTFTATVTDPDGAVSAPSTLSIVVSAAQVPTTTSTTTTTLAPTTTTATTLAPTTTNVSGQIPDTGNNAGPGVAIAVLLVVGGGALAFAARRRGTAPQ